MTPALVDLARALVALPGWRWEAGMLVCGAGWFAAARICDADPTDGKPDLWEYRGYTRGPCAAGSLADTSPWDYADAYPDLTDAATGGVLLGMLLDVALVDLNGMRGTVTLQLVVREEYYRGTTLGEACARALVALGRCA